MNEIDAVANAFSLAEADRPLADCTEQWADVFRDRAAIAIAALDKHREEREPGPDETPEERAKRLELLDKLNKGGIDRRSTPSMWYDKGYNL